ncbi:MAG: glycosyltransferase family 39 protein [Vicinamibacterales bacterium]|nr:glycosyltransferase family 39 protein [Vicinamibacterales bacterium]
MTPRVLAAGVTIGVLYTLSPLLVVTGLGFALVLRWVARTPDEGERRWLVTMLVLAIGLRLLVIGALFLLTDHETTPFGTFFGDEDYFIRRSIWLRNLALGIPISLADTFYAYDPSIQTSIVWPLAVLHVLFGPSPYGVHLVSVLLYVAGAVVLYRTVRPSFGLPASLGGLALLLFLPSLFAWSVSVLKEPVFFALMAAVVAITVSAARHPSWALRVAAVLVVGLAAWGAQSLRDGGLVIAGVGTGAGVLAAVILQRPRLAAVLVAALLVAAPIVLTRGAVQDRIVAGVARAAEKHWNHVNTPGLSYRLFEPAFYETLPAPGDLTFGEGVTLVAGGLAAYVVMPAPWAMESRSALAFLPEQIVWYGLLFLLPIGLWEGWRRDPFLTAVLGVQLVVAVALVAVTSGNMGTLVRHRAIALPALVWFASLGLTVALARLPGGDPIGGTALRGAGR